MTRRRARPAPGERERERRAGSFGERLAAEFLERHGYVVAARNLRTRCGEVDLLVRRRRLWVAVEVKSRSTHPAPERAVDAAQLARIRDALLALAPSLRPPPRALRVDVVAVRCGSSDAIEVRHFPGSPFAPCSG